jgi:hypothetical protein
MRGGGGGVSQRPLPWTHSGMTTASLSSRFASSEPMSSERSQSNPGADVGSGERSPGADVGGVSPAPAGATQARGIGMGGVRIGGREKESRQCRRLNVATSRQGGAAGLSFAGASWAASEGLDGTERARAELRYPLRRPSVSGKPPGFQYPYRHYQYPYRNYQHPYRSSHETPIGILSTLIAMVQPRARRRDGRHRVAGVAPRGQRANKHTSKQASKQTKTDQRARNRGRRPAAAPRRREWRATSPLCPSSARRGSRGRCPA